MHLHLKLAHTQQMRICLRRTSQQSGSSCCALPSVNFGLFAGCIGAMGDCGITFYVPLPRTVPDATLSYKVRFSAGYDWTAGGKLPGVCSECAALICISAVWQLACCNALHCCMSAEHSRTPAFSCFTHVKVVPRAHNESIAGGIDRFMVR